MKKRFADSFNSKYHVASGRVSQPPPSHLKERILLSKQPDMRHDAEVGPGACLELVCCGTGRKAEGHEHNQSATRQNMYIGGAPYADLQLSTSGREALASSRERGMASEVCVTLICCKYGADMVQKGTKTKSTLPLPDVGLGKDMVLGKVLRQAV